MWQGNGRNEAIGELPSAALEIADRLDVPPAAMAIVVGVLSVINRLVGPLSLSAVTSRIPRRYREERDQRQH